MTTEKLIRKAVQGDHGAIEKLYDAFAPRMLSLCFRYCANREDAEDVLHDGFIKILKGLPDFSYRDNAGFEAWIKRIMVNTSLNSLRSKPATRMIDETDLPDLLAYEEDAGDHFMELAGELSQETLLSMIAGLPPGYRTVFNLYVFENYTHREIANLTGCSENTSKSQLSKARAFLRKKLNQMVLNEVSSVYENE